MKLNLFTETFAILKLPSGSPFRHALDDRSADFLAVVSDCHGTTLVSPIAKAAEFAALDPSSIQPTWRCFQVDGILEFQLVGILADLTNILQQADISVCAISSFDTDYLFVFSELVADATRAFRNAGHQVNAWPAT